MFLVTPNTTLVGLGSVEEAVAWLRENRAVILGFEGFRTDGISLVPLLDYIADFSAIEGSPADRVAKTAEAALVVLSRWRGGGPEFIEFIVEDESKDAGPRKLRL
jgi:hypothetical protein